MSFYVIKFVTWYVLCQNWFIWNIKKYILKIKNRKETVEIQKYNKINKFWSPEENTSTFIPK